MAHSSPRAAVIMHLIWILEKLLCKNHRRRLALRPLNVSFPPPAPIYSLLWHLLTEVKAKCSCYLANDMQTYLHFS